MAGIPGGRLLNEAAKERPMEVLKSASGVIEAAIPACIELRAKHWSWQQIADWLAMRGIHTTWRSLAVSACRFRKKHGLKRPSEAA